ncbi:serine/threonine kinase [Aureococcus anophagefferens]|nr:serine/threonine kinase [Aureococcus anophagefferens]
MRIGSAIRSGSSRGRVQPVEYATGPPPAGSRGSTGDAPAAAVRRRDAARVRRRQGRVAEDVRAVRGLGAAAEQLRRPGRLRRRRRRPAAVRRRPAAARERRVGAERGGYAPPQPRGAKAPAAPVSAWLNGRHPGTPDVPGSAGSNRNRPGFGRPGSASSASKGRDPAPAQSSERREYRPGAASSQRPGHKPAGSSGYGQSYDRPASAHAASGRDAAAAKAAAYQREQRDRDQQSGALRPQSASARAPVRVAERARQRLLVGGTSSGAYPSSGGYSTRPQSAQPTREYLTRLLVGSVQNRRGCPTRGGKVIGVGSFGTVRIAWHKLTGQKVAIKTYERSKMKDPQQPSRPWRRGARLIMEFLPGGNLCSYVKAKRKIAEPELQPLMLQLATALHHMHELNIVHRDIKLENILFLDEKRTIVRVIDFGFSTRCAPDRRLRLFCGTPSYMAPEIVRRTEYRGKPIDLWSIGVVAYACLGGHFPFAARSQPELYRKILRGTYRLPEGLSPNAVALLQACIVVDVNRRVTAPDLRRHPFVVAGASNGTYPGANLGSLTRSQNPQDDVRREAVARIEALGVSRDALIQGITRGEHTPITSCYYLLMDSMGLRTGPGPHGSTSHGTLKHNNENELPQDAQAPRSPTRRLKPGGRAPVSARSHAPPLPPRPRIGRSPS